MDKELINQIIDELMKRKHIKSLTFLDADSLSIMKDLILTEREMFRVVNRKIEDENMNAFFYLLIAAKFASTVILDIEKATDSLDVTEFYKELLDKTIAQFRQSEKYDPIMESMINGEN